MVSGLNWAQWTLIAILALSVIVAILTVGQERSPRTPGEACAAVIINLACIWLVVEAGS